MGYKTIIQVGLVFFLLCIFLVVYSSVAQAMTSQFLYHEGLTISQPFKLLETRGVTVVTLQFGEAPELSVTKSTDKEVLAEAIITTVPEEEPVPTQILEEIIEPTLKPTAIPTAAPTAQPQPTQAPTTPQLSNGGLDAEKLFTMANNYRATKGLPALQKDDRSCQLAASRAPEIANEVTSGAMHSGLRARNLPYWNSENIISMRNEEEAFNWWINDKIHHDAIVGNYTYSCVACYGNSCAQEFTNYQPK